MAEKETSMTPGKTTREAVLRALEGGPLDTIEIAKTTRIEARTVGAMCNRLLAEGVLQRKKGAKAVTGQKANVWRLRPTDKPLRYDNGLDDVVL
jgi:predicted ArsR family transcriptional regulator